MEDEKKYTNKIWKEEGTLDENWYVLCLAIIKSMTVEQAFSIWEGVKWNHTYTSEDVEDMTKMRETMTYKEIGEIYGISESATYKRINRYKKNRPTAMVAAM